jgi:16S rRNA (uracil1498-N3)-methyltransferase
MASVVRLYVDHPLGVGQSVPLSRDQSHYLFSVMRKGVDEVLELFNGRDGEWLARVVEAGKKTGILRCESQSKPIMLPADLWLMFAPIKKARTDFIVEKATEMGAGKIMPVYTDFTNSERVRQDRLQSHAVEAAEQCGGTFVPPVMELQKLSTLLDAWDDRQIMFCDEMRIGQAISLSQQPGPWAVLIGPEGGFSARERIRLDAMSQAHVVSLGPRILRADTAVVAALALWQTTLGDWR